MSINLKEWQPVKIPNAKPLEGRFIRLVKLDPALHGDGLWAALQGPGADEKLWDYLPYGPFLERKDFDTWITRLAAGTDPWFYTVIDRETGVIDGYITLMCIVPEHGRIEIGHVTFGAAMQRTPKGTEAIYLLAKESFALGNRRLEWKCNDNNLRSKRAAERFGFTFEGTFRNHMVVKGKNRDTSWYSIIDEEWPALQQAFESWLSEGNFRDGQQIKTLEVLRAS
ncbi:GNAT family N-acetyltransferase [Pseudomonas sp. NA-150]|uniref:GNAT family N-acetyltransferase n=1 Tax=Pseudomonas sp. NA-150 TaxID=3367525 RepID=UPI0037C90BAA